MKTDNGYTAEQVKEYYLNGVVSHTTKTSFHILY